MTCLVCGRICNTFQSLSSHIKIHNITSKEYYDLYLKSEDEHLCYCGNQKRWSSLRNGYTQYCSHRCSSNHPSTQKKYRDTCILKYGRKSHNNVDEIKKLKKETLHRNYDGGFKNPKIRKRKKDTCIHRYGVTHQLKSELVQEKQKQTCITKYDESNVSKVDSIKRKKKDTCNRNHSVDYPMQSEDIQQKQIRTVQKRYGCDNVSQNKKVRDKIKRSLFLKYGVDNYSKCDEARELFREKLIDRINKSYSMYGTFTPCIGLLETQVLNELQNYCDYNIHRQKRMSGYFPDGFIEEINLIVEFYENWHRYKWAIKHDEYRRNFLINKYNCGFFIINESDWLHDKTGVINQFVGYI